MKYKTEDFTSPTGSKVLVASYDEETKEVSFELARGYYYPSDRISDNYTGLAQQFAKEHATNVNTVAEENAYLKELGIDVQFRKDEDLEGKWTFANLKLSGWKHEAYDTKVEAIEQARKLFPNNGATVVGQLKRFIDTYHPENQEYVKYD